MLLATRTGRLYVPDISKVCWGHGSAVDYRPFQGIVVSGKVYTYRYSGVGLLLCVSDS